MPVKRLGFVVNPVSGRGAGPGLVQGAMSTLHRAGTETLVHETRGPGDARDWAATRGRAFDVVVCVGGDGTLREVIEGLDGGGTVGVIPAGTANVVARDLGIPRSGAGAVRVLLEGRPRSLDVGRVNGRPFLAMVGVGFDGEVVRSLCDSRRGPIRMSSYVLPGLRSFLHHRPQPLAVTVDDRPSRNGAFGMIICNTRNYGGFLSVAPQARMDDGWLDFQMQLGSGRTSLLVLSLAALMHRRPPSHLAAYGRGRRIKVEAGTPVPVQVDGDAFGTTPVEVEVEAARVSILAPATAETGPEKKGA